jgi:hypothetical protein
MNKFKKTLRLSLILVAVCSLLIGSATMTAHGTSALTPGKKQLSAATEQELARARNATAKYHDVARAEADGYVFNACVPGEGLEYINFALVDCTFDIEHPEALHYITQGNRLRLVGVEYVVPIACTATAPEGFTGDADVWEFMGEGLPIWNLRVALWLHNPDGIFAEDNPRVPNCP